MTEDRVPTLPPCPICGKRDLFTGTDGRIGCPHCEVAVRLTEDRVPTHDESCCWPDQHDGAPHRDCPGIGPAMTENRVPPWTAHGYISRAYERTADVDSMIARLHEYGYEIQPVGRLTRLRGTLSLIADGRGPARQMAAEALRRDGDD